MNKEDVEKQLRIPLTEIRPRGNNLEVFIAFGKIGEISGLSIAARQIAAQESKRLLWQNVWGQFRNEVLAALRKRMLLKSDYIFIPMQDRLGKVLESRVSTNMICIFEYYFDFALNEWAVEIKQ